MSIDLDDLEVKARAATEGSWSIYVDLGVSYIDSDAVPATRQPLAKVYAANDAAYIVAAQPSVVIGLIARVRELEAGTCGPATATHRHKKRGTEYVLIGIGKMQTEGWGRHWPEGHPGRMKGTIETVDMAEVAIYRSIEDGSLWVRPREEFEDGRFESILGAATALRAPLIETAARDLLKSIDFDNSGQVIGQHRVGGHGGLISPETTRAADALRQLLEESK